MNTRIISMLVCLLFVATSMFGQSDFVKGGIYYKINPNLKDVTVTSCPQDSAIYSGKIVIPAKVEYDGNAYSVTHIGKYAFKNSEITAVTLPEGIIEIGEEAFRECSGLKSVTIPASVLHIGKQAFIFCFSLSTLSFKSASRPVIDSYAFGKTKVTVSGIDTGIPANMAVPNQDKRFKTGGGVVTY